MNKSSSWINMKDQWPDPDFDYCIMLWMPKNNNHNRVGIPVICHYREVSSGLIFTKVTKGYFNPNGTLYHLRDFEFWKSCDDLYRTEPPEAYLRNELLDTVPFCNKRVETKIDQKKSEEAIPEGVLMI